MDIEPNELGERNEPVEETNEVEEEEADLGEPSGEGDNLLNKSIQVPQDFNPELGEAPDAPTGREVGTVKRLFTMEKKAFIREALKVNINKVDGPNVTTLFDNLQLTTD